MARTPTPALSIAERAQWLEYGAHADISTGDNARPSAKTIAKLVGCTPRIISPGRTKLVALGYLVVDGEHVPTLGGRPRPDRAVPRFSVRIPRTDLCSGRDDGDDISAAEAEPSGLNPVPERGELSSPTGTNSVQTTLTQRPKPKDLNHDDVALVCEGRAGATRTSPRLASSAEVGEVGEVAVITERVATKSGPREIAPAAEQSRSRTARLSSDLSTERVSRLVVGAIGSGARTTDEIRSYVLKRATASPLGDDEEDLRWREAERQNGLADLVPEASRERPMCRCGGASTSDGRCLKCGRWTEDT
jgi:hypothetical protein